MVYARLRSWLEPQLQAIVRSGVTPSLKSREPQIPMEPTFGAGREAGFVDARTGTSEANYFGTYHSLPLGQGREQYAPPPRPGQARCGGQSAFGTGVVDTF